MKSVSLRSFLVLALLAPLAHAAPLVKSGTKVAFLGDSITQQGAGGPGGYVRLVESGLKAAGIPIEVIPAGISGHKSNDMLARLDKDVLSKKPDVMTLSCGVNDVWHGARGVELEAYKKNITEIVDRTQKAGVQVVILTSTLIGPKLDDANNTKAKAYNDFLRDLAKERKLPVADLNADMIVEQSKDSTVGGKANVTSDGVHMNHLGNIMMAKGVLKAFDLSSGDLAKAEASWQAIPDAVTLNVKAKLSLKQMSALESYAASQKKSVDAVVTDLVNKAIQGAVK
ncbi:MAG: SGNH/GDSL hydrolase family protein [Verrucomicrobium sp.]|nr:SGNH/GDSL hydrolase family protein [Verrucomicrobium sp.]